MQDHEIEKCLRRVSGTNAPVHVIRRLAALIRDEEVQYAAWSRQDRDGLTFGEGVMITDTLILQFSATGSSWDDDLRHAPDASTVEVRCWPRTRLVGVSIEATAGNEDAAWQQEWSSGWPNGAALALDVGSDQIRLRRRSNGETTDFAELVAGLVRDMGRPN